MRRAAHRPAAASLARSYRAPLCAGPSIKIFCSTNWVSARRSFWKRGDEECRLGAFFAAAAALFLCTQSVRFYITRSAVCGAESACAAITEWVVALLGNDTRKSTRARRNCIIYIYIASVYMCASGVFVVYSQSAQLAQSVRTGVKRPIHGERQWCDALELIATNASTWKLQSQLHVSSQQSEY